MAKSTRKTVSKTVKTSTKAAVEAPQVDPVVRPQEPKPGPASVNTPALAPSAPQTTKVTKEERHRMIAEAAYYISLRRGPSSDPMKNWLEAEAQIDAQLKLDGRL